MMNNTTPAFLPGVDTPNQVTQTPGMLSQMENEASYMKNEVGSMMPSMPSVDVFTNPRDVIPNGK